MSISISVRFKVVPPSSSIEYELDPGSHRCSEVIQDLSRDSKHPKEGAWQLLEMWNNCKRIVHPKEDLCQLKEEWGCLDSAKFKLQQKTPRKKAPTLTKAIRTKKIFDLISQPKHFLKKSTHKRLYYAKWVLEKALRQSQKKYSNLLLNRILKRDPLWGPSETTPLDSLQTELSSRKSKNLLLSSEIADLNITSTRLRSETHTLRQKEQELAKKFSELQMKVTIKREEKERRGPKDLTRVQTDIIKLKREFDMRNRLNASQTSRLKAQKEILTEKRKFLEERQKELVELEKPPVIVSPPSRSQATGTGKPDITTIEKALSIEESPCSLAPVSKEQDTNISSTIKKRHASRFEAKTKQLTEEEGVSFHKMKSQTQFDIEDNEIELLQASNPYPKSVIDLYKEGPDVLVIPRVDKNWYMNSQDISFDSCVKGEFCIEHQKPNSNGNNLMDEQKKTANDILTSVYEQTPTKKKANVRFSKEAVILNAALEGELDLLKECIRELGSCSQASDKGATCLHNAVCSGNVEMVKFLVEMGCNINAQDIDGWTPLHCAVAYSNLDMIQYLINNGGSLFLTTQDGDTPLAIGVEECESQKRNQDNQEENHKAVECLHFLMDIQTNLGVANNHEVYALFSHHSSESDELSFDEGELLVITDRGGRGEQWWTAVNTTGNTGLVPSTYLGSQCRHSVVL